MLVLAEHAGDCDQMTGDRETCWAKGLTCPSPTDIGSSTANRHSTWYTSASVLNFTIKLTRPLPDPLHIMAEESLNLSLDDIIKRNADSSKRNRNGGGAAKRGGRGGRGGRSGDRTSSFQPRIQTRVVKTIRGRGAGRPPSRGRIVRVFSRDECLHSQVCRQFRSDTNRPAD